MLPQLPSALCRPRMLLQLLLFAVSLVSTSSRDLVGKHFIGYNVVNLQSGNFTSDPAYAAATHSLLRAGILRYPGGNLADFWDWETGWCVTAAGAQGCPKCTNPCLKKTEKRIYRLEEFQVAIQKAQAKVVLMINMLTMDLSNQLRYLQHAQTIGLLQAGTYVELGGEFYWGKYAGKFQTGQDYATEANVWAQAIKQQFPTVTIMVVAAHSTANQAPTDRGYAWNGLVYATVNTAFVDGVTLHPYLHLDNPFGGSAPLQPSVPPRTKGEGPTGWFNDSGVQQTNVDFLRSKSGIESLLGVPFFVATSAQGNAATHQKLPSNLRMIVTETNVMERAGPLKLSWLHGLFMATTVFNLMSIPQVDAVLLHVLLNGYGWGALYETDHDFTGPFGGIPPKGSMSTALGRTGCLVAACHNLETKSYMPTAVGVALGALSESMAEAEHAEPLQFNNTMNLTGLLPSGMTGTVVYPSLFGFRFSSTGASTANATVLNLGDFWLDYNVVDCLSYTSWTTPDASAHAHPLSWVSTTRKVNVTTEQCGGGRADSGEGGRSGAPKNTLVMLPPYSITTVRFPTNSPTNAAL